MSLHQKVWHDLATMQQDVLLHYWVIFLYRNQAEILQNATKNTEVQNCWASVVRGSHDLMV